MNNDIQSLANRLFWEKLERARHIEPELRMKAGPELFDYACGITLTALREQMPEASEAQLLETLRRRLNIKRRLEDVPR